MDVLIKTLILSFIVCGLLACDPAQQDGKTIRPIEPDLQSEAKKAKKTATLSAISDEH